jgi:hypothetical protein
VKRLLIEVGAALVAVAVVACVVAYYRGQVADLREQLEAAERDAETANEALELTASKLGAYEKATAAKVEAILDAAEDMERRNETLENIDSDWGACVLPDGVRNAFSHYTKSYNSAACGNANPLR